MYQNGAIIEIVMEVDMQDYLFNQNVLIGLSILTTVLCQLYLQTILKTSRSSFKKLPQATGLVLAAVALFIIELVSVAVIFSLDNIPASGYYLLFIFDALLVLTVFYWRTSTTSRVLGISSSICTLLLMGASVNNFYQYYPNLGFLFANKHAFYTQNRPIINVSNPRNFNAPTSLESRLHPKLAYKGSLYSTQIPGITSGFKARDALLYLPPAYDAQSVTFPVIILLTGVPGSPGDWLHGEHFEQTMDSFAARHQGISPVVVIPDHNGTFNNDTECVNSNRGNVETYLTTDVPTYLKSHFHVSQSQANWAIGGLSEGGMCAAMLTLRHQNIYQHFLDMSGDPAPFLRNSVQSSQILFHNSYQDQQEHNINWLLQNKPIEPGITGQFIIGNNDNSSLIDKMRRSYSLARSKGMAVSFERIPYQGHNAKAWGLAYQEALPKLSYFIGATNCESFCPK
ncbi:MAG: hypothetical protein JWP13_106 [Candidatus Saccharibacteria bacterium]|nr:hypothetical protein [Candidatus Saccharibacteria bacterium]